MFRDMKLTKAGALLAMALSTACGARSSLEAPSTGSDGGGGGTAPNGKCGDGIVETGESCDDANHVDTDLCRNDCQKARCGDGVKSAFEACDDGNTIDTDGCRNDCSLPSCGDGVVENGEACDSPNPDLCTPLCLLPACGDGFVAPSKEACDLGASNDDRPAIRLIHDGASQSVIPVRGAADAVGFYDYQSASAHTGFEKLHTSNLFLYQESGVSGLDLFTIHGIDRDSSGQSEGDGRVDETFGGLPASAFVALVDDNKKELAMAGSGQAVGSWDFHDNTDGGVLGGIPFPGTWIITVDATFLTAITSFRYDDAKTGPVGLAGTHVVLQAFDSPSACRTDCTVPRCGDGILDGGEVCDDGNTAGGDGCSADCKSTS